jgi:hypothetical protein
MIVRTKHTITTTFGPRPEIWKKYQTLTTDNFSTIHTCIKMYSWKAQRSSLSFQKCIGRAVNVYIELYMPDFAQVHIIFSAGPWVFLTLHSYIFDSYVKLKYRFLSTHTELLHNRGNTPGTHLLHKSFVSSICVVPQISTPFLWWCNWFWVTADACGKPGQ